MLNQGKIVRCSWEKFQSISHDPDILYVIKDKGQIWMGDKCIADTPKDIWSLGIINTEVGKTVKITEVDEDGKPIAWEAVDGVEAFNRQGDWEQNESTKPDYIKNRTHYRVEEHIDEKQYDLPSADNLLPLVLGEEWYAKGTYQNTPDKYLPQGDKVLLPVVTNNSGDLCICSDGYTDFPTGSEKYNCFVVYADHIYQNAEWKNGSRAEVQVLYRAAYSKVQYKTIDENYIPTTIPRALSASAGDILQVKSVDEDGKPTEWEAVENSTETLTVNLTKGDDESITADKTFAEIKEAFDNGKLVMAKFMEAVSVPLIRINGSVADFQVMKDNRMLYFECVSHGGSDEWNFAFRDMATVNDARSLGISSASVGQIVKVKSVDSSGKPTEWEAVEFPEQVQSDWNQADETAADYVKNRPFGNVAYDGILFGEYGSNGWRLERVPDASAFYGIQGTRKAEIRRYGDVVNTGSANISASDYDGSVNIEYTSTSGHTIINISGEYGVIDNINVQSSEGIGGWGTYELHIDGLYYEGYIKLSADKVDIDTKSLGLTGATAGDMLKIKAIDDSGRPTEWETVNTTEIAEAAASIVDTSLLNIIGEVS